MLLTVTMMFLAFFRLMQLRKTRNTLKIVKMLLAAKVGILVILENGGNAPQGTILVMVSVADIMAQRKMMLDACENLAR